MHNGCTSRPHRDPLWLPRDQPVAGFCIAEHQMTSHKVRNNTFHGVQLLVNALAYGISIGSLEKSRCIYLFYLFINALFVYYHAINNNDNNNNRLINSYLTLTTYMNYIFMSK